MRSIVSDCAHHDSPFFNFKISMSVLLTLMAVTKSVPTLMGHLSVAATVVTLSPMMEGLVWMTMNVH